MHTDGMTLRPFALIAGVFGAGCLVAVWVAAVALQRSAYQPPIPVEERLLIAGQVFAVAVAWRWPVGGALLAGASIGLTAAAGYQGSLAVGMLPIVVLVASIRGDARDGGIAALIVGAGWLWFILAVAGPAPALSEYFGVALGTTLPFLAVQLARTVRRRRASSR